MSGFRRARAPTAAAVLVPRRAALYQKTAHAPRRLRHWMFLERRRLHGRGVL